MILVINSTYVDINNINGPSHKSNQLITWFDGPLSSYIIKRGHYLTRKE